MTQGDLRNAVLVNLFVMSIHIYAVSKRIGDLRPGHVRRRTQKFSFSSKPFRLHFFSM